MIKLKNINLSYHNKKIFDNFNLTVTEKERVVILGKSGVGKSTLLRLIAGFIAPDSGEVFINKTLVTKDKKILIEPHLRDINMVFQDLALWPHLCVGDNIAFGLKIKKINKDESKKRVLKILDMLGLNGFENRRIEKLSGGEQQRVALARALVLSPKILLMDEPLSSLDAQLNRSLRKEIISLQEKLGFTLVYVTHNEEEAKEIATRKIILP